MIHSRPSRRIAAGLVVGFGCIALAFQSIAATSATFAPLVSQETAEQEPEAEEESGPLHESMEILQGGMRSMRKMMTKPEQKDAALELCRKMQAATLVGFQNPPEPAEGVEGDAAMEHSVDFRRRMLAVCGLLVDLEVAIQKEDADAAKEAYKALGKSKKEGHDKYL